MKHFTSIKNGFFQGIFTISLLISLNFNATATDIEKSFRNPPESTKPWTYWYWLSGHISKEGITKDLEAMASTGYGEAFISNVHDDNLKPGKVEMLTPEWWEMMKHAVKEASRLGMKIGLFNCPGWSMSGGPWVTTDKTMRYLTSSETRVSGGKLISLKLENSVENFQRVAVLAFPKPLNDEVKISDCVQSVEADNKLQSAENLFDGDKNTFVLFHSYPATIYLTLKNFQEVRSLSLIPAEVPMNAYCELEYQDQNNYWRPILRTKIDRQITEYHGGFMKYGPIAESFSPVRARKFRITFTDGGATLPWIHLTEHKALGCIAEIELSSKAILTKYSEKQLGRMTPTPYINWDTYMWKTQEEPDNNELVLKRDKIIEITKYVNSEGVLKWNVPEGEWIIQQIGMTPTGSKNHPVLPAAKGWEIDKMNKAYTKFHYDNYIGVLLNKLTASERKSLRHVVMDSYEQGPQNWTDGMTEIFRANFGYDPTPWLPVLSGRIVNSANESDRFLWDLRRLSATMIAKEYIGGMREKANADGMRLWCENYGFGFPGESLMYGGMSDDVGGEFWNSQTEIGPSECRIASSAANIYGKNKTSAEAFTSHWNYITMPRDMRSQGDLMFTHGVNHYVWHLYIHQAYDRKPGVNAWFGSDLNRNNTWFFKTKAYFDYVRRSCALLQSGLHSADVLYYLGEDTPKQSGSLNPMLPYGYDYDFINAEVLLRDAKVIDHKIVLSSGIKYSVLVLPDQDDMRPEVLTKVGQLIREGARVVGRKPVKSQGLQNFPQSDTIVRRLASEIWNNKVEDAREHNFGKGTAFSNVSLEYVFGRLGIRPDVIMPGLFNFTHRVVENSQIYFITNQSGTNHSAEIAFNVQGMQPELFDAVTGNIRSLPEFTERNNMTYVPMEFTENSSWFVVFRTKATAKMQGVNFEKYKPLMQIDRSWNVSFDPKLRAPKNIEFKTLTDWTLHPDNAIRYYSGTATYSCTFELKQKPTGKLFLNLGTVEKMADIRINGKQAGSLWCYPYRIEITNLVQSGTNKLEIDITNAWLNRVKGDEIENRPDRITWTTMPTGWLKNEPLASSGLLGPVLVESTVN
jgi:hypothetical protein